MKIGTIVLTRFPFTDLTSAKRRPAVILSKVNSNDADVIVGFISSVIPKIVFDSDFILKTSDLDFPKTGLKTISVFKMNKLATLDSSIFTGELGEVSPLILEKLKACLRNALDL
jgi:mRNA interferase MazF